MTFSWSAFFRPLHWLTILFVFIADQATKFWVLQNIGRGDRIDFLPFLSLVHTKNRGAAFGIFHESSGLFRALFFGAFTILCVYILTYWLGTLPKTERVQRFSLALILGGALGNVVDRVYFGHVTDFIDFFVGDYHWPAFNIADSAITTGVVLVFLLLAPQTLRAFKNKYFRRGT